MPRGHPKGFRWTTPEARFWQKVLKLPSGCWEWQACTQPVANHPELRGYGQFVVDGRKWLTHVLSWTWTHGPVPPGLFVLHHCDNRPCVNPDHLFLGTKQDNTHDALAKGRLPCGGATTWAKLLPAHVQEIRSLAGTTTFIALGLRFGVNEATIRAIVYRKNWKQLI